MEDNETPRGDGRLDLHDESGMTRRDLMRRGAVVGGTLLWVAPAIQSIGSKAYAVDRGTPLCEVCVEVNVTGEPVAHLNYAETTECCECVTTGGGDALAIFLCALAGTCVPAGLPELGPC